MENNIIISNNIQWQKNHEEIFIEWADKSMCYKWLHQQSHKSYTFKYQMIMIPVIIMSTLSGTANFAQERIPLEYRSYSQMIIGGVNIFAGILTTISQFLKINELNESHRASALMWDRFYRSIKIELLKERKDRPNITQFLSKCQEQYDSLIEISPDIDDVIVQKFMKSFSNEDDFETILKPDVCNELVSVRKYVVTPYKKQCLDREQNLIEEQNLVKGQDQDIESNISSDKLNETISTNESDIKLINIYKSKK